MTDARCERIKKGISAFSKKAYRKEEVIDELFKFQKEIVDLTFGDNQPDESKLRLYDAYRYLEKKNAELNAGVDEEMTKFKECCEQLSAMIGREVAGSKGERKVFRTLETLNTENILLKNVELMSEDNRAEIDAVVITPKTIFLLEVKNPSNDMIIDARGNYYKAHRPADYNRNIAEKVNAKEYLLKKTIKESNLPDELKKVKVITIVVFANSQMHCDNRHKSIKICYSSNLPQRIDEYAGPEKYSREEMKCIAKSIEDERRNEAYPVEFDFEGFKECFATIMSAIELADRQTSGNKHKEIWIDKSSRMNKKIGNWVSAVLSATMVGAVALAGTAYKISK